MVGYSEKHGHGIWRKYLVEGVCGYARMNYSKAKRGKLTYEQEAQVNKEAATSGFGSQAEVQSYIFEQFGVRLAVSNVGKLLHRLEVTATVPRPRNHLTSKAEQSEYKKNTVSG